MSIQGDLDDITKRLKTKTRVAQFGHFPKLELTIQPLSTATSATASLTKLNKGLQATAPDALVISNFLEYEFASNILVPCDSFSFKFVAPDLDPNETLIEPGALVDLNVDGFNVFTGILDTYEVDIDEKGTTYSVHGRDLMSQLEDQDAISIDSKPIFTREIRIKAILDILVKGTRIQGIVLQDMPNSVNLFASEPGESKLSALQRFLEPLNCLAWMSPDGRIIVGRPNFAQDSSGIIMAHKKQRFSNVTSLRATRSPTQIPNVLVGIYAEQDLQIGLQPNQSHDNSAAAPSRLRQNGHRVVKACVTSIPKDAKPKSLPSINFLNKHGSGALFEYVQREFARQNHKELIVQCSSPGHFDPSGNPWVVDKVYEVFSDVANINEPMYCFGVEYHLSSDRGQYTQISLCKLNTIVSGAVTPGGSFVKEI